MADSSTLSSLKVFVFAALSASGGILGALVARPLVAALPASPAWVGPAILIGSVALLVTGLLLLPVAIRAAKAKSRKPTV